MPALAEELALVFFSITDRKKSDAFLDQLYSLGQFFEL
jgi:hypothetical protein